MILPEDMPHIAPRFAAAGLTAKLVVAETDRLVAEMEALPNYKGRVS